MRYVLALALVLGLTVGLGIALNHLGEDSRVTSSYTALL